MAKRGIKLKGQTHRFARTRPSDIPANHRIFSIVSIGIFSTVQFTDNMNIPQAAHANPDAGTGRPMCLPFFYNVFHFIITADAQKKGRPHRAAPTGSSYPIHLKISELGLT